MRSNNRNDAGLFFLGLIVMMVLMLLSSGTWAAEVTETGGLSESAMWVIGQTIVLLIVIIGAAVRHIGRLSAVETKVDMSHKHIDTRINDLRDDHGGLAKQVLGISRSLARIEGANSTRLPEGDDRRAQDG